MFPPTYVYVYIYFPFSLENMVYFIYYAFLLFIAILVIQHTIRSYFTHAFFLMVTLRKLLYYVA